MCNLEHWNYAQSNYTADTVMVATAHIATEQLFNRICQVAPTSTLI